MNRRPYIPLRVKLYVALRQLGLDPKTAVLDHHPPLEQRMKRTMPDGRVVYSPDANDPRYLQWLGPIENAIKTTGRRGMSKLSKRGGDLSEIAKTKRLEEAEFRRRMLTKGAPVNSVDLGEKPKRAWPKRKIPSRPMGHGRKSNRRLRGAD